MKEGCKKCPFKFDNFSFKNVIIVLLTIQAIWNLFKESGRDMNIEDLLVKGLGNSSSVPHMLSNMSPMLGNLSPMLGNLSPMLGNLSPIIDELSPILNEIKTPPVPKVPCSGSWMLTKVLLIMLFFYLVYFIKTIIEKISVGMELNVNTGTPYMDCPLSGCPLGFGGGNLFEESNMRCKKKCDIQKQQSDEKNREL
jgi:hypothetical protein